MDMLSVTTLGKSAPTVQRPVLDIENFGKISRASMRLAPFTIICGRNNSGKSYLASLLWALYNMDSEIFRIRSGGLKPPSWFLNLLKEAEQESNAHFLRIDHKKVSLHVNKWIAENKDAIVKRLMNHDRTRIGSIKLNMERDLFIKKGGERPDGFNGADLTFNDWSLSWQADPEQITAGWMASTTGKGLPPANLLYGDVIERILFGQSFNSAQYIPASRSGLLISISYISDYLLSTLTSDDNERRASFSAPVVSFLRSIVRPGGGENEKSSQIADFLESSVLNGRVKRSGESGRPEFSYRPSGSKANIPLHASSSMVTELTSVIERLRQTHPGHALILEEPEAHLHLSAQRQMARALVRLCNSGVPVVVTTHSDTFIQQINFLLLLSRNKKRLKLAKALGYSKEEFLKEEDVVAYELVPDGARCAAVDLAIGEFGLTPKTISDVVVNLSHEILEVSEG